MRGHVYHATRRRQLAQARDLSERITIRQLVYEDGRRTEEYVDRARNVPARLFRTTGDQVFTEDTLRIEHDISFQIRHRPVAADDLVVWEDTTYEVRAVVNIVPRRWIQVNCRVLE